MLLSKDQKRELIAQYLPMLYISVSDIGLPIDPLDFVAKSALWVARRPELDNKTLWGLPGGAGTAVRRPLVSRGAIDVNSLPTIQREFHDDELWLECASWQGSNRVEPTENNREANLARLRDLFPRTKTEPIFRAEVCDIQSWKEIGASQQARTLLGLTSAELMDWMQNLIVVQFQVLFAGHFERGKTEIFPDQASYASSDYEADWSSYCVFLHANVEVTSKFTPKYAGFYRQFRGQSASFGENRTIGRYKIVAWHDVPKFGDRACVLVATGSHNLHPANVPTTSTAHVKPQSESLGYGDNLTDDVNKWVQDTVQGNQQVPAAIAAVTIAKMLAGGAIAGPLGALGGLIAGIAEAKSIAEAVGRDPDPIEIDPSDAKPPDGDLDDPNDEFSDDGPEPQAYIVIADDLTGISDADLTQFLTFPATIDERRVWASTSFEPIDRDVEGFWPFYDGENSRGYCGRWGVRCEADPFNRRTGAMLPDYRLEIARAALLEMMV